MPDLPKPPSFQEQLAKLQAERGRSLVPVEEAKPERALKAVPDIDEDLIPEVYDRSDEDIQLDTIISQIGVLDAYRRWIGKTVVESETKLREGAHFSCPWPWHPDKNPQAFYNQDKNTWHCMHCDRGGDIYDLAAIHFGYDLQTYKQGANFHKLRRDMAEDYGYRFKTVPGGEVIYREEEAEDAPPSRPPGPTPPTPILQAPQPPPPTPGVQPSPEPEPEPPAAAVVHLREEDVEDEADEVTYPVLNWRSIVPEETFLHAYLEATSNDDSPEEYHFWHGLLALGHACGRNVFLTDTRPVFGNLLVCLLGGTGYGKSRSRAWLDELLMDALPFQDNGIDCTGVKILSVPASGENLIKQFDHVAWDPTNPGKKTFSIHTPVNGIVDYDEFAGLLARASRQGSTLKPIIMGMSDAKHRVSTASNTGGEYEAIDPFCSITASTQPKAVRRLLNSTDTASGFLNRWIFVGGPRKEREVIGGAHSSIRVDLTRASEELTFIHAWSAGKKEITFSDEALDEFNLFMKKNVFPVQMRDKTDLLTRLDLTMKRLILLFCMNEKQTEVTVEIVQAVEPILQYLMKCYAILDEQIGISMMGEIATEILRHIDRIKEATGKGASVRDLSLRMKRKAYSPDLIKRTLETMVALDWIELEKNQGPGRPTVRYRTVASAS